VPGSFVVSLDRHLEGLVSLDRETAGTFGEVAALLARAIQAATKAARVYLVAIGESHPHFHYVLAARSPDLPARLRAYGFLAGTQEMLDPEQAATIAGQVRRALEDAAGQPGPG
jgi:diadenosine tetraphosphate (Ap4A) HIT family hydrolase